MSILRRAAWPLGLIVGSLFYLRYLAGFSPKQTGSILFVLVILLLYIDHTLSDRSVAGQRRDANFAAHCVVVRPNWHTIFVDYRVVKDAEEFRLAWEKGLNETPLISFTVLRPERDADSPGLVYWDSHKSFLSEAAFEQRCRGIAFSHPLDHEHQGPVVMEGPSAEGNLEFVLRPQVYFNWAGRAGRGYEMGLTVRDEWWRHMCSTGALGELANTHADTNHLTGETRLALAILPYSEFQIYYDGWDYDDKRRRRREESRERELAASGWQRQERDPDDPWTQLEHKYFTVQHRAI